MPSDVHYCQQLVTAAVTYAESANLDHMPMFPLETEEVEVQQTQQNHQNTPMQTSQKTPHKLCSHENKTCSNPGQALQQGQLSKLKMKMTLGFLALFWMPAQARVARDDQHVFVVVQMMDLGATAM